MFHDLSVWEIALTCDLFFAWFDRSLLINYLVSSFAILPVCVRSALPYKLMLVLLVPKYFYAKRTTASSDCGAIPWRLTWSVGGTRQQAIRPRRHLPADPKMFHKPHVQEAGILERCRRDQGSQKGPDGLVPVSVNRVLGPYSPRLPSRRPIVRMHYCIRSIVHTALSTFRRTDRSVKNRTLNYKITLTNSTQNWYQRRLTTLRIMRRTDEEHWLPR